MIAASHVSKVFHRGRGLLSRAEVVRAVDDVSLRLDDHEVFGLVGQSGSGKTTLGMALCGIMRPTSGLVEAVGAGTRPTAQMVFQDPRESLNPRMRVHELIVEPLAVRGSPRREREPRVSEVMAEVQLDTSLLERYPHELSGGQRQRVAIARAVIARPDLVIADEPTSMLDAAVAADTIALLRTLAHAEKITFVIISHDLAQVAQACDRIGVMHAGKLVELGAPNEICLAPATDAARVLVEAARRRETSLGFG